MAYRDRSYSRRSRTRSSQRARRESDGGPRRNTKSDSRHPIATDNTVPDEVLRRLDTDPLFKVETLDRAYWIDPFTGQPILCPEGVRAAAQKHWQETGAWRMMVPHSLEQLVAIRWRVDLRRILPKDRRLRQFGSGTLGWLNPFSGEFEATVQRDNGQISLRTVNAMSQVLARCPFAEAGIMMGDDVLKKRLASVGSSDDGGDAAEDDPSSSSVIGDLSDDLRRATDVQRNMLRDLPAIPGWDIGVCYQPQAAVSGDFYEVMCRPDGTILVVVGDVSGHGVQAALVVVSVLKSIRQLGPISTDVVDFSSRLNDDIKQDLLPGQFVTLFVGIIDPVQSRMRCVLAGHHHMLMVQRSGILMRQVGNPGMAMGLVVGDAFRSSLKPEVVEVEPGSVLVQYTDGLIEALDDDDEEFGVTRFAGAVLSQSDAPVQELADQAVEMVQDFANGDVDDDVTVLAIKRLNKPD